MNEMKQELLKRFFKPIYIPLIVLISIFLFISEFDKVKIYIFLSVLLLNFRNIFRPSICLISLIPFILFLIFYLSYFKINNAKNYIKNTSYKISYQNFFLITLIFHINYYSRGIIWNTLYPYFLTI